MLEFHCICFALSSCNSFDTGKSILAVKIHGGDKVLYFILHVQ